MFDCHRIDQVDADGRLVSAGLEWTEGRNWLFSIYVSTIMALGLGTGMALVAAPFVPSPVLALISAAAMGGLGWLLWNTPLHAIPRQLLFCRDGSIHAPLGFSWYDSKHRMVSATIADVVSIEARQLVKPHPDSTNPFTHGVVLYERSGDTVYIASRLHPDAAHKVAVQLMLGLTALRTDMADGGDSTSGGTPNAREQAQPIKKKTID